MNLEVLEHILVTMKEQNVILIQPSFGRVSDSYYGKLDVTTSPSHHVIFTFYSVGSSKIFEAADVLRIDPPVQGCKESVIRMKGPYDYADKYKNPALC